MSKFVLPAKKRKPSENPRGEVIRISKDAYNTLTDMANCRTLPIVRLHHLQSSIRLKILHWKMMQKARSNNGKQSDSRQM